MKLRTVSSVVFFAVAASTCAAQATGATPGPPMGWNSWDSYGLTVDEAQFRANAKVEAQKLLPAGYRYAVIDEGWFLRNPAIIE